MSTLNLTRELERVVADIILRVEEFAHVDPARLLLCVTTTRAGGVHGVFAKIHPLRFPGGSITAEIKRGRRRRTCTMPAITHAGEEMLYLVYFLVPRFLDLPFREKLITIFHELYHISPDFNGDIRRFPGRNYAHGSSTRRYNEVMAALVDRYLEKMENPENLSFLEDDSATLRTRFSAIVGRKHPIPRFLVS